MYVSIYKGPVHSQNSDDTTRPASEVNSIGNLRKASTGFSSGSLMAKMYQLSVSCKVCRWFD